MYLKQNGKGTMNTIIVANMSDFNHEDGDNLYSTFQGMH